VNLPSLRANIDPRGAAWRQGLITEFDARAPERTCGYCLSVGINATVYVKFKRGLRSELPAPLWL